MSGGRLGGSQAVGTLKTCVPWQEELLSVWRRRARSPASPWQVGLGKCCEGDRAEGDRAPMASGPHACGRRRCLLGWGWAWLSLGVF